MLRKRQRPCDARRSGDSRHPTLRLDQLSRRPGAIAVRECADPPNRGDRCWHWGGARGAFRRSPRRPCGRGCRRTGMTEPLASDRFRSAAVEPCAPSDCCAGTSVASQRSPSIICAIELGMSVLVCVLAAGTPLSTTPGRRQSPTARVDLAGESVIQGDRILCEFGCWRGFRRQRWGWRFSVRRRCRRRTGRFSCRPRRRTTIASHRRTRPSRSRNERSGHRVTPLPIML